MRACLDLGRYEITKDARDWGSFTPALREVANAGPYMHDGSLKSLDEVIEFYDKGGTWNKNLDPLSSRSSRLGTRRRIS